MSDLAKGKCLPCTEGTAPLTKEEIVPLQKELSDTWHVEDEKKLVRKYRFKNFKEALDFTVKVGNLAEEEGHHPDIMLGWGRVTITLMTHKIKGLSKSDFVLAAKIDQL
jgi:4a-hydroxytetrahydrobiopterin dehydratase